MTAALSSSRLLRPSDLEAGEDQFIRVADVLELRHKHPPSEFNAFLSEPMSHDDCLVVRQRNLKAFYLEGPHTWADYTVLRQRFAEMRRAGGGTHNSPYTQEEVFAPVKVLLAERDHPISAVLTYEPAYPWQSKLGLPKPGWSLWWTYAAVAVLNTVYGEALYQRERQRIPLKSRQPHGLKLEALRRVPVARRQHRAEPFAKTVRLCHQAITLQEGWEEVAELLAGRLEEPSLVGRIRQRFQGARSTVGIRLQSAVCELLGLTEDEERALRESVNPSSRLNYLPPAEFLGELPSTCVRVSLTQGLGDLERSDRELYLLLLHWEHCLAQMPPEELCAESPSEG